MNTGRESRGGRSRLHRRAGDCGSGRVAAHAQVFIWLMLMAGVANVGTTGCAVNRATGERHLELIGETQEIALGRQADSQIVASLGLYASPDLQQYAQQLGVQLAKTSERPGLPWTFRVIDDPVVNAFALPGGFIYVTRGLMTHVDNEAELSAVVGHEIGHVTAKHAVNRMSTQQLAEIGVMAGMILKPELQKFGQLLSVGLGLMYLKFSRDDESQADHLGLRYMLRGGYDPTQMIQVFNLLTRVSEAGGGGRVPEWLATHPNPEQRTERIQKELDTLQIAPGTLLVNRDSYLSLIDGTVFGENPREGFFRENHFYQPEMAFEFEFPPGWKTVNQKNAVAAVSTKQDAVLQITLAQGTSSEAAAGQFFAQEGLQAGPLVRSSLNGLTAVSGEFRAQTEEVVLQGKATFVEYKGNTYELLGYTTEALWSSYKGAVVASMETFRPLTDPKILQVQPLHLKIHTVTTASTLAELASQVSSPVPLATLAIINNTQAQASFRTGDRVKLVIGVRLDN